MSPRCRRLQVVFIAVALIGVVMVATSAMVPLAKSGAATQPGSPAFTKAETITRSFVNQNAQGQDQLQVVDSRNFSVSVAQTTDLRNRQEVNVSWSGAHPTGGIMPDPNLDLGAQQEYPVVLMECRGVDSATAPAAQQISPETCWTQTPGERTDAGSLVFPSWRLDYYASAADRGPDPGIVLPFPQACYSGGSIERWIHFIAVDGTDYPNGPFGCGGISPDETDVEDPSLPPSDTTYAVSDTTGDGSSDFVISTAESNGSLGCSQTVACSLVIIPIMGISCDPYGQGLPSDDVPTPGTVFDQAKSRCEETGAFKPGEYSSGSPNIEDESVSGLLWWSPSNWRNRVSVPLSFAEAGDICSVTNNSPPLRIYGSELMAQASLQWEPAFCLDPKLFNLFHVQIGEPEAKSLLLSGSIEAAFQAMPPDPPPGQTSYFASPTVQAPVALTGFAIGYVIDTSSGQRYTQLKLDARLLAKLMTESYPGDNNIASGEPALRHNPIDIAADPEFRALNPILPGGQTYTDAAATLFSISGQSDVIDALTSYINADPVARAWLNGTPDPWGMTVNPAYKGIKLPVETWPLLDTVKTGPDYSGENANQCLEATPVPVRPLVDAPRSSLSQVTINLQFGIAATAISCLRNGGNNYQLVSQGRETAGQAFIIGIVPLSAALEYGIDTASLETEVTPSAALAKFTDATGRTFVAPSQTSLAAAAALLQPDPSLGSWTFPYEDFGADSKAAGAYPGTMLISLDVPTKGLAAVDAKRYSQVMQFAATTGQAPGYGNGQLPPGYLPMTAANGLGNEVAYTQAAATAVAAQAGQIPELIPSSPTPTSTTVPTSSTTTATQTGDLAGSGTGNAGDGSTVGGTPSHQSTPGSQASSGTSATGSKSEPGGSPTQRAEAIEPAAAVGTTPGSGSGIGGVALPIALLVLLVGGIGAAVTTFSPRRRR